MRIPGNQLDLIMLSLTNSGEIKILNYFPYSFVFLSHKPTLIKATLISSPGTGRYLQLTSHATLHSNSVC